MSETTTYIVLGVAAVIVSPVLVFLWAKMGAMGVLRARQFFNDEQNHNNHKVPEEETHDGNDQTRA